jgi:hypothetical protein
MSFVVLNVCCIGTLNIKEGLEEEEYAEEEPQESNEKAETVSNAATERFIEQNDAAEPEPLPAAPELQAMSMVSQRHVLPGEVITTVREYRLPPGVTVDAKGQCIQTPGVVTNMPPVMLPQAPQANSSYVVRRTATSVPQSTTAVNLTTRPMIAQTRTRSVSPVREVVTTQPVVRERFATVSSLPVVREGVSPMIATPPVVTESLPPVVREGLAPASARRP